jgi:hypothetical protein
MHAPATGKTLVMATICGAALCGVLLAGCATPVEPDEASSPSVAAHDGSLRIAALDYDVGDLSDPAELAKYTRADILIVQCDQFWGRPEFAGRMAQLRVAKPELKVIGYFRSKAIKDFWGDYPQQAYNHDLYQAAQPYLCRTTTGDTLQDWPRVSVFDFTDPACRAAMLDIFEHYQNTSGNRFDGVFWDYFATSLWIAPQVTTMEGEPDMDQDGVPHWDDADELRAFLDAQDAWVDEMQSRMGRDFIQIANGYRAAVDSTFAGKLDGMFYEIFPNVGFTGAQKFQQALDPARFNNLFAAREWPRTGNGGPWLILSHAPLVGGYVGDDGLWHPVDAGDVTRIVALLTGGTAIHYDGTGGHRAGIPDVEYDLGAPLGGVTVEGGRIERSFERGVVSLEMGSGAYPLPFDYRVAQRGLIVDEVVSRQ